MVSNYFGMVLGYPTIWEYYRRVSRVFMYLLFNKLLLHGLRIRGLCLGRVYILLICSKRVSTTVLISKYNIIG